MSAAVLQHHIHASHKNGPTFIIYLLYTYMSVHVHIIPSY